MVRSFIRKSGFLLFSGALLLVGALLHAACEDVKKSHASTQKPEDLAETLAKVDDVVISVGEFQDRINKQSPYVRARYTSLERKKEFLDNLVRFEVLAKEAERRGLTKDAEVVRTMKQVMIQKLLKDEFDKLTLKDITDDTCKTYFDGHKDEFNQAEEARVSLILVKDAATAKKVMADARIKGVDNAGYRSLVAQYSLDQATKERGGDLRYFNAASKEVPKEIVETAFKMQNVGDNSEPVKTAQGVALLKLTGKRKALNRAFDEVKEQIRNKLYREKRQDSMETYVKKLREKAQIKIDEVKLAKVQIEGAGPGSFPGPGLPPPGPGQFHPGAPGAPKRRRAQCRACRRARRASRCRRRDRPRPRSRPRSRRQPTLGARDQPQPSLRSPMHRMSRQAPSASLALATLCLALAPAHAGRLIERVVAVVNDEIVLESEVEQVAAPMLRGPADVESAEGKKAWNDVKRKALDQLVDQHLVSQQAAELRLTVTMDEIDRAMDELKHQNNLTDAAFLEALKQQGFTLAGFRKNLKEQILGHKVLNVTVRSRVSISDDEIKTYYQQNERQMSGQKTAHLRHILVAVAGDAPAAEVEEKRRVAAKVVELARAGKSFTELAKAYSDDELTKAAGGDLRVGGPGRLGGGARRRGGHHGCGRRARADPDRARMARAQPGRAQDHRHPPARRGQRSNPQDPLRSADREGQPGLAPRASQESPHRSPPVAAQGTAVLSRARRAGVHPADADGDETPSGPRARRC